MSVQQNRHVTVGTAKIFYLFKISIVIIFAYLELIVMQHMLEQGCTCSLFLLLILSPPPPPPPSHSIFPLMPTLSPSLSLSHMHHSHKYKHGRAHTHTHRLYTHTDRYIRFLTQTPMHRSQNARCIWDF